MAGCATCPPAAGGWGEQGQGALGQAQPASRCCQRPGPARRWVVVEVVKSSRPTARGWWPREVGQPLDRKQVQGVMPAHRLLPFRNGDRRRRPGSFG